MKTYKNQIKFYAINILMLLSFTLTINLSNNAKEMDSILESMVENNKPPKEIFKNYHKYHQKTYKLNSEEGLKRYRIFKKNLIWNKERNDLLGAKVYGLTPFMDITDEEFKKRHLMDPMEMEKHLPKGTKFNMKQTPTPLTTTSQIDWRILYEKNPVQDQGTCGGCWSFAANTAIEANYKKKFGVDKKLSTQYLLDCDTDDNGCNG